MIKICLLALANVLVNKTTGQPITIEALNWEMIFSLTALWSLNNIEISVDKL